MATVTISLISPAGNPLSLTLLPEERGNKEAWQQAVDLLHGADKAATFLRGEGWLPTGSGAPVQVEPSGPELARKLEQIGGWTLGERADEQPVVQLWSTNAKLEFPLIPVWEEDFPLLPFSPLDSGAKRYEGDAISRARAESKGYVNPWRATVELVQELDHEGKPKLTKNGNPAYRFARVVDAT